MEGYHKHHRENPSCVFQDVLSRFLEDWGGNEIAFLNIFGQLAKIESTSNSLFSCTQIYKCSKKSPYFQVFALLL